MIIFCVEFLAQPKNTIALCSEKLKLSIFMAAPNWFIGISVWIHLLLIVFTLSWLKISIIVAYTDHLNKKCLKSSRGITKSIRFIMLLFIPSDKKIYFEALFEWQCKSKNRSNMTCQITFNQICPFLCLQIECWMKSM